MSARWRRADSRSRCVATSRVRHRSRVWEKADDTQAATDRHLHRSGSGRQSGCGLSARRLAGRGHDAGDRGREQSVGDRVYDTGGRGLSPPLVTPNVEVDLCGRPTLAAAFVVLEELRSGTERVAFETLSGHLSVARQGADLVMDISAQPAHPVPPPVLSTAPASAHYVAVCPRAQRRSRASAPIRRCWRPSWGDRRPATMSARSLA